jgi:anti-anti-sigma regulatory factor
MLRITKTFDDERTVYLRLDGRVDESVLSELKQSVLEHRNKRDKAITLDFSGVVFVDDAGVKFLRKKMKHKRVKIVDCSLFIKTLIGDLIEEEAF